MMESSIEFVEKSRSGLSSVRMGLVSSVTSGVASVSELCRPTRIMSMIPVMNAWVVEGSVCDSGVCGGDIGDVVTDDGRAIDDLGPKGAAFAPVNIGCFLLGNTSGCSVGGGLTENEGE